MPTPNKRSNAILLGVSTLLFPPLALVLLWTTTTGTWRRIIRSIGILLCCLPYAALVIWLLIRYTGLQVEWRGGFPPVVTYSKTVPDYAAVERHRAEQAKRPPPPVAQKAMVDGPAYWTDFRGPKRDGHYDETPILTNWPAAGLRELWREPVGGGYASFVVAKGLAFTIEQRRDLEVVAAYEAATGREVWTNSWPASFQESMGGDGPRATPTYHEGKLYALGAEGDFACLDAATGKTLWSKNIRADNATGTPTYGFSSSPLVVDDNVIVAAGGSDSKGMVAYNAQTGAPVWHALADGAAHSSPMIVSLAGRRQLLVATGNRVVGLAVEDGKLLWEHPWIVNMGNRNIAQPVILGDNRFMLSAGYGTGAEAVEITKSDSGFTARTVWKNKLLKNKFTSSVFWQGNVYGLDEDVLTCLDAATGERRWKDGRYDYGQLLLADGCLVILSGMGDVALVRATPARFEEMGRFSALHGKTWNHPAIAEGRLFVRNAVEMACFDIGAR